MKISYKSFIFFIILLIEFPFIRAHAESTYGNIPPKREVRAVWLTTIGGIDWPHSYSQSEYSAEKQKNELRNILDKLQKAGINTVLIQTRIRGTVIYPSQYEPWDGCLSGFPGKSPGYDALQFAIEECHKRGMELHAWVVTMPVGKWNALGCKQLRKKFPKLIRQIGPDGYMNPEDPQTASYLTDICEEITTNYDIDGIHLDYIRYPETWNIKVPLNRGRDYITGIVRSIHDKVKAIKPWVKMSCSPIGKFDDLSRYWSHGWNAYTKVCQDAQGWLREGLMDELFPMMYFQGNQFFPFAIDWAEQSSGKIIAPGLGIYFMSPQESNWELSSITREMEVLRQYGLGHAYFRSKFFTDDTKGIYRFATNEFDKYPALVPAMTWEHTAPPTPPISLNINKKNGMNLSWYGATDRSHSPYLMYNVYCSDTYPVDIDDARNLIASRIKDTNINLPLSTSDRYYAVTAIDRYGNESTPIESDEPQKAISKTQLLYCDGNILTLPFKDKNLDVDVLTIETLQGAIIATCPYNNGIVNISNIKNGFYVLRSLNAKGISHRLCNFVVKRR